LGVLKKILIIILLFFSSTPSVITDAGEPTHQLIIYEVMAGSEVNPEKDHWIELYNPTDAEILLIGWQLQGVTLGGRWVDITEEDYRAIQPKSHFLISHYTNSRSSALEVKPQINKTSIQFPPGFIEILLRDPQGLMADQIRIERTEPESDFRSYERKLPVTDGQLAESWGRAQAQVNLKTGLTATYATPFSPNSDALAVLAPESAPEEDYEEATIDFNLYLEPEPQPESEPESVPVETPPDPPPPTPPPSPPWILINEILPNPKKRDQENEFIELINLDSSPVDLRGWELDDENTEDDRSYFLIDEGRDYVLDPGEIIPLYSNETLISLGNLGDGVELFDAEGRAIDSYFYNPDLTGRSWARDPANPENWIALNHPTPGGPNVEINRPPLPLLRLQQDSRYLTVNVTAEESYDPDGDTLIYLWEYEPSGTDTRKNPTEYQYSTPGFKRISLVVTDEYGLSASTSALFEAIIPPGSSYRSVSAYPDLALIHEFSVNPEGNDEAGEWIELFNSTPDTLELGGWYLDDAEGKSPPFRIPDRTFMDSNQYLLFKAPDLKLSLKNSDDEVRLLDPNQVPKQIISYQGARENWSYAQSLEGHFEWSPFLTPEKPNLLLQDFSEGITLPVHRVIDGDTFETEFHEALIPVRLLGVDTPETVHPKKIVELFGPEASAYLKERLNGQNIRLTFDEEKSDKYSRLLAYVYLGEDFINAELISKGYARAYTRFPFKHLESFVALQAAAKAARVGLWQNGSERLKSAEPEVAPEIAENDKLSESLETTFADPSSGEPNASISSLCFSDHLKIQSIMPNALKGDSMEFIRLINQGDTPVCLEGWLLDDDIGKGSKPFKLKGGGLAPGAVRTFRKSETGLALNNQNDCANLIDPQSHVADQICYGKTHAGELFTHAGGDWQPKKRVVKVKRVVAKRLVPTMYQVGTTAGKGNGMVMSSVLRTPKTVVSSLDVAMAQDLVELSQLPVPAKIAVTPSPVAPIADNPPLSIAFSTGVAFLVLVVLRRLIF